MHRQKGVWEGKEVGAWSQKILYPAQTTCDNLFYNITK
jgi:hypothetical protein